MKKNTFLFNNLLILILLNSGNVFAYLFQLIVGRNLTPEAYGSFNSLNSLGVLISTPITVLPLVLSKYTIHFSMEGSAKVRGLLRAFLKWLSLSAICVFLLGIISLPAIKQFLKLDESLPVMIIILQMSLCMLIPVTMGILQGLERFLGFGLAGSGYPLMRFIAGILLVGVLGFGVNGALVSGLVGVIFSIGIGLLFLKDLFRGPHEALPPGTLLEMFRYAIPVLLTSSMVSAMGNLDLVMVRHFCDPKEAGFYATAAILGRIAFYLPGVLIMVLFPAAAKSHINGQRDRRALWLSLSMTGLFGVGFALICSFYPEMIINILFGSEYVESGPLFRLISIAMATLAIANVFFTFSLAHSHYTYIWVLGTGLAGMLMAMLYFHSTPEQIAWSLIGSTAYILIGTMLWFFIRHKN